MMSVSFYCSCWATICERARRMATIWPPASQPIIASRSFSAIAGKAAVPSNSYSRSGGLSDAPPSSLMLR